MSEAQDDKQMRQSDQYEEPEGLDQEDASWGDYPLDEMLIRHERRKPFLRRVGYIDAYAYTMNGVMS